MRLRKIRLAGFKSFVDPTTIELPGDLIGVVGPNGCGKSNIIDAVRWVMGEVSAKHLRGDTMADVVFTGSNSRKPVGQASVELVFDNTDGRLGGRFAVYEEISVRRQVTRESQSTYYLNGARCRRRDVMDVFMGTGLGPRSYAIIEQGMISRLIEARPEELRDFLEEAAGISRYKERRRETENRIRRTKENLDRLSDLREELGKQLTHLKRQATQAARYKEYKEEERRLEAELLALRWQRLDGEASAHQERITTQETVLERVHADLRRAEAQIERQRVEQGEQSEAFNQVYRDVLDAGAAIARGEESIQGMRERERQLGESLSAEQANLSGAKQHIREDERRLTELETALGEGEPDLARLQTRGAEARQAFRQTEEAMHAWQAEWEDLTARVAEPARSAHAEEARIQQIEHNRADLERRLEQMASEREAIDLAPLQDTETELGRALDDVAHSLSDLEQRAESQRGVITALREERREHGHELQIARSTHQEARGRLASLAALQEEALRKSDGEPRRWLEARGLQAASRLAEVMEVDEGWESAVEMVLGFRLEAAAVGSLAGHLRELPSLQAGPLTLFDEASAGPERSAVSGGAALLDKVRMPGSFVTTLDGVLTAPDLEAAIAAQPRLAGGQSLVTPDGIWVGPDWVHVPERDARAGVLRRARELEELQAEADRLADEIEHRAEAEAGCARRLVEAEEQIAALQDELAERNREQARLQSELGSVKARVEQLSRRAQSLAGDEQQARQRYENDGRVLDAARERLERSREEVERLSVEREAWSRQRDQHRLRLEEARERWQSSRDEVYDLGLKVESMRAQAEALREGRSRNHQRVESLERRCRELDEQAHAVVAPLQGAQAQLEQDLARRADLERDMTEARRRLEGVESSLSELESTRQRETARGDTERQALEQLRLEGQEFVVRRRTLEEQLGQRELSPGAVLDTLEEGAGESAWEQRLEALAVRINRLGPINLAAIDEHVQQAERKDYLDSQHADLVEALDTLESAIQKIDRETRARFKDTYEKVNAGLQATFPRLFGGGQASLELTGDDLLSTGVSVMARPPGKRNSSIHLLSGGEKALTAVALVFAIFDLNPAPFCLLDEVDAPLDDVNVVRFCELVKEMSERVQLVVVTHNKITMEASQQLVGVTMNEPGVSRLVAVDVDEAVKLATA